MLQEHHDAPQPRRLLCVGKTEGRMKHVRNPSRMIDHGAHNQPQSGTKRQMLAARGEWKLRHGMKPNRAERRAMGVDE